MVGEVAMATKHGSGEVRGKAVKADIIDKHTARYTLTHYIAES